MGPIIATSGKKDTMIREVLDNLLFDLNDWYKAYEATDLTATRMVSQFGQKMPQDVKTQFDQLMQMYSADPPLITAAYFRDACRDMGIDIPVEVNGQAIADERAQMAEASDPYGARVDEEMRGESTGEEDTGEEPPAEDA
jgi:hypothetical protein